MKRYIASTLLAGAILTAAGSENARWLRDAAISPDGTTVAFTYKGDIFTVPVNGGEAKQITSNNAYDAKPVWTPDGFLIVFMSTR